MSNRNINVLLTGNATSLRSTLIGAGRDVETFEKKAEGIGKSGSRSMQLWGAAAKAGGVVVAAALAYSVAKAAEFETQMRNVNSISKLSESALSALGDQVIKLSTQLPQSASELASGLYDIASSGFQGAAGLQILKASAVAASAGLSDTATSAKAIVAVINAYGLSASDAAHVSNVLFEGVNVGVLTFEELASTVGDFVGTASAAKVPIEDATAALATMTLSGISAAEGGTSLNRVLQGIIAPSDALAKQYKVLGYESGSAALQQRGLQGVIEDLRKSSQGNIDVLLQWFPEIRAARGALALMANEGENYARASKAMQDADKGGGAARQALNEQLKSLSAQMKLFVNWANAGAITLGTALLPVLKDAGAGLQAFLRSLGTIATDVGQRLEPAVNSLRDAWNSLWQVAKDLIATLGPMAGLLVGIFGGAVIASINAISEAIQGMAGFLEKHPALVRIAAVAWGVYAASVLAARVAEISFGETKIVAWLTGSLIPAIGEAVGGWAALIAVEGVAKGTMSALGAALTSNAAALLGIAAVLYGLAMSWQSAGQRARDFVKDAEAKIDTSNLDDYRDAQRKMQEELDQTFDAQHSTGNIQLYANTVGDAIGHIFGVDVHNSAQDFLRDTQALNDGMSDMAKTASLGEAGIAKLTQEISKQKGLKLPEDIADLNGELRKLAAANNIDFSKPYAEWSQQLVDVYYKSGATTGAQASIREGFLKVAGSADDAKTALDGFKTALDGIYGVTISVFDAQTKHAEAIQTLAAAILTNGSTLDAYTEKGKANREALSGAAQSALDYATAVAGRDGVAAGVQVFTVLRGQILGVMQQMGLTKDEAEKMADAIGLTPDNLQLTMQLAGADTAAAQVDAFLKAQAAKTAEPEIKPKVGDKAKRQALLDLGSILKDFKDDDNMVTIGIDKTQATQTLSYMKVAFRNYKSSNPKTRALLEDADPKKRLAGINALTDEYVKRNPTAKAFMDSLSAENRIKVLNLLLQSYNGKHVTAVASVDTAIAEQKLNVLTRQRFVNIGVTGPGGHLAAVTQANSRWGNVFSYATGGITGAHVATKQVYKYAEPETGGEAFVPKRGSAPRSLGILDTAAGWYGHRVVPMARGGFVDARPITAGGARAELHPAFTVKVYVGNREVTDIVRTEIRRDDRKKSMAGRAS